MENGMQGVLWYPFWQRQLYLAYMSLWNSYQSSSFLGFSDTLWSEYVVEPSVKIIRSYLNKDKSFLYDSEAKNGDVGSKLNERDLWTQHVCKVRNYCLSRWIINLFWLVYFMQIQFECLFIIIIIWFLDFGG